MRRHFAILLLIALRVMPTSAQDAGHCPADTRPVEHALGTACVPDAPARVVSLDMAVTELLLWVERPPVAYSETVLASYERMLPDQAEFFDVLRESGVDIGFPPNIETVLSAAPDLIIGPRDLFTESLYPQLAEIAPTVLYDPAPGDWRARLIFAGDALGLNAEVDALMADYGARVDLLREMLGTADAFAEASTTPEAMSPDTPSPAPLTVSLVRAFPGQVGLLLTGTSADAVLRSVGLARPEAQALDLDYVQNVLDGRPELLISLEDLALADADLVLVFGDASELRDNPLWLALPAVRDGRAHEVGYHWWGDSLLTAHIMLDDLFKYAVGGDD
jgi:iron complex transport system substrate-binding protein